MIIEADHRVFVAGLDIKEAAAAIRFDVQRRTVNDRALVQPTEGLDKPVTAVVIRMAFGGGCEASSITAMNRPILSLVFGWPSTPSSKTR